MDSQHISLSKFLRLLFVPLMCLACVLSVQAYTVVIDAGHGGKDHGAIDNNIREKDVNLGVALKLEKLLKKQKDIKVVLTRDKDEYLTLQRRADIANQAKGDLFVSIHTNSVAETNPNRTTVAGASTYTLGLNKDAANMDVARRENNVMTYESNYETKYSGFDPNSDESYIIFEMAQRSNMAQSIKFANKVQQQMSKVASRRDRGVHQAGFWVLWATSMPAALIELDFICNPNSAKYIGSEKGQEEMAQAICNAITQYFTDFSKHEKERLRTEHSKPADSENVDTPENGVVLAAVAPIEQKTTEAPAANVPAERTRKPAARRRRSEAAREKSEQQEYEVAVIPEQVQYVAAVTETPADPVVSTEPEPAKVPAKGNDKQRKTKQAKQQKDANKGAVAQTNGTRRTTVNGRTVIVVSNEKAAEQPAPEVAQAPSPAPKPAAKPATKPAAKATTEKPAAETAAAPRPRKSDANRAQLNAHARLARVNTVYKIQIYSCDKILKEKDPLFGGLSPVTCSKNGDLYTYYYGESDNQSEIYRLLADVQKVFPEAKVVKARRQ